MLKHYVFWGLFALVCVGIVVTQIRRIKQLRRDRAAKEEAAARHAAAAASVPVDAAPPPAFDPNATRIHFRASPAAAASALPKRDEAILPADGSARLVCVGGNQKGNSFPLTTAGVTVGRDPSSDIVIADPRASQRHAWVGIIDRKAVLRDLESTNGTFLNAQMDALVREVVLNPGDTIFFGGHGGDQFRFVAE